MGPTGSLTDSCSVCGAILRAAPHKWPNVRRRDRFNLMAELHQLASPIVRCGAPLHTNKAWLGVLEELDHLASPERGGFDHQTPGIYRVDVKAMLGQSA